MTAVQKHFSVDQILIRAEELGIQLSVSGGELVIKAAKGKVTPQALQVFRQYKQELLQALQPLCSTCLDNGVETLALDDGYEGLHYCSRHHPLYRDESEQKNRFDNAVEQLAQVFPGGCAIHFDAPGYTIQDRAREIVIAERIRQRTKRIMGRSTTVIDLGGRRQKMR